MTTSPLIPLSANPAAIALVAVWLMQDEATLDSTEAQARASVLLEEPELNFTPEELMLIALAVGE